MNERRKHDRIPMEVEVNIRHSSFGEMLVHTRDISDSGLFLKLDVAKLPPVGSVLTAQVIGMAAEPPVVSLEIVRVARDGIGVKFV